MPVDHVDVPALYGVAREHVGVSLALRVEFAGARVTSVRVTPGVNVVNGNRFWNDVNAALFGRERE